MWGTLYVEFFTQLLWFVIPFANQVFQLKKEKNRKQDRCQRWELLPTTIDHHRRSNPTLTSPTDTLCSGQNTLLCRCYKRLDCFGFNFMFCAQTSCYSRLHCYIIRLRGESHVRHPLQHTRRRRVKWLTFALSLTLQALKLQHTHKHTECIFSHHINPSDQFNERHTRLGLPTPATALELTNIIR